MLDFDCGEKEMEKYTYIYSTYIYIRMYIYVRVYVCVFDD